MMKIQFFLAIFILPVFAFSQIKIDGVVINKDSFGIPYSRIVISSVPEYDILYRLVSDEEGKFSITIDSASVISIDIFAKGYNSVAYSYNIKQDTTIYFDMVKQTTVILRKPIIYLYPEQENIVDVKLNVNGTITNTYPEYKNGWTVLASPNGDLVNQSDGKNHRYLFWDGKVKKQYQVSDFKTGFVVSKNETSIFLDSVLTVVGLNDYEKNDFISFWMPLMKQNDYNFVHFLIGNDCNDIATLSVNPSPDSEIRVYMVWGQIDEHFDIQPQNLTPCKRKGFTLMEWGGFDLADMNLF